MAIKKIKGSEFVEANFFKNYVDSAEKAKQVTKGLVEAIKGISKETKAEIKAFSPKSLKDVESFYKATSKAREEITLLEKAEQKLATQEKTLIALKTDEKYKKTVVATERLRQEKNALTKKTREEVALERKLDSAYSRQSRTLNQLRKKYKDVALTMGENSKQARNLLKQIRPLDKALKRVDNRVGQNQRSVGKYTNALRGLAGSLGIIGGIAGAFRLFKNSINIVKNFEKQVATTAGVLGVTKSEASGLADEAKRLGSVTEFSAIQVGSLQEAYARLGFTQSEIIGVTEATLRGATALQADLGESASLVGSTLNQFKLGAEDSSRVVDILAKSTQISALSFSKLQTALPVVGKTAQVAGVSLEKTASMLGVLSSNGIDASTSATALRNIFIETAKKGITLEEAYAKINGSTDKLSTATELFGKRGATVALTLSENIDKTNDYNDKLSNAGGTAEKLAETQLNTLDGALKILNSAWEGYILNLNDASGGGSALTKVIRFLSKNLETIIDTIGAVAIGFGVYKLAIIGANLVTKIGAVVNTAYRISVIAMARGTKSATKAIKGMSMAMKANPIGLVAVAIVGLIALVSKLTGKLSDAEKIQNSLNNAQKEAELSIAGERAELEKLVSIAQDESRSKKDRQTAIEELNKISPEYLGNLNLETIGTDKGTTAIDNYVLALGRKAKAIALNNELVRIEEELIKNKNKTTSEQIGFFESLGASTSAMLSNPFDTNKQVIANMKSRASIASRNAKDNSASLNAQKQAILKELSNSSAEDIISPAGGGGGGGDGGGGGSKKPLTELKKLQNELKKTQDIREKLLKNPSDKLTPTFIEATDKAEALKIQIKELQDILANKRDNVKFEAVEMKGTSEKEKLKKAQDKALADSAQLVRELEQEAIEQEMLRISRIESFESMSQRFHDLGMERSDAKISAIDNEISAMQERANEFERLANNGNAKSAQSLALLKQEQAEATLAKEKEMKKQKRMALAMAVINTYSAELKQEGATASSAMNKTIKSGALLTSLVAGIGSFYEGTEDTGTVARPLDSKGGRLSVLHDNERVVNKKNNQHLKGITNDELGAIGQLYKSGDLFNNTQAIGVPISNNGLNNDAILSKFDKLESAIKSIPNRSFEFDRVEKVVTEITQIRNKTERTKRRINL